MKMPNKFELIYPVNLQVITLFNQPVSFAFLSVTHTFITVSTSLSKTFLFSFLCSGS